MAHKGAIAASIVGGLVALGAIVYFLAPSVITRTPPVDEPDNNNTITPPTMHLLLLESDADASPPVARYEANNTKPIVLQRDEHIRFESPNSRNAEGMQVTSRNLDTDVVELLRKSYNVNNQYFVSLDEGRYEFTVRATWAEKGSFFYGYDVTVVA